MTFGRPPESNLSATGAELKPGLSEGLLGNAHQRKNRGRYSLVLPGGPAVTLLDLSGDEQLAAGAQLAVSVLPEGAAVPGEESRMIPELVGKLTFGTDGVSHQLEFDVCQGVTLSVAGSYMRLDVRMPAPLEADEPVLNVQARASLGYFPWSQPLRRSYAARAVADNVATDTPIPPFARRVEVLRSPMPSTVVVAILDRLGFPLVVLNTAFAVDLPIPPNAASVSVLNGSGAALNQLTTMFHLWV